MGGRVGKRGGKGRKRSDAIQERCNVACLSSHMLSCHDSPATVTLFSDLCQDRWQLNRTPICKTSSLDQISWKQSCQC